MQQLTNIQEIETAVNEYGEIVISKNNKDVGILVNEFYKNNKLIKTGYKKDIISIKVHDKVNVGDTVVITNDKSISLETEEYIKNNKRKILVRGRLDANINGITLKVSDGVNDVCVKGKNVFKSLSKDTTKIDISTKLNKLESTVYKFDKLEINIEPGLFIPLKEINKLKSEFVSVLNEKRLYKTNRFRYR